MQATAIVMAILRQQQDQVDGVVRAVLLPHIHPCPPDPELVAAWGVLRWEPQRAGVEVAVTDRAEVPGVDPLVLLRWPPGVLPDDAGQHLVLWGDQLWWCPGWSRLAGIDSAALGRFTIPMARRAYARSVANKLMPVQPLPAPTALAYYAKHKYSESKPGGSPPMRKSLFRRLGTALLGLLTGRTGGGRAGSFDPVYSYLEVRGERFELGGHGVINRRLAHRPVPGTVTLEVVAETGRLLWLVFDERGEPGSVVQTLPGPRFVLDAGLTHVRHDVGRLSLALAGPDVFPAGTYALVGYEYER